MGLGWAQCSWAIYGCDLQGAFSSFVSRFRPTNPASPSSTKNIFGSAPPANTLSPLARDTFQGAQTGVTRIAKRSVAEIMGVQKSLEKHAAELKTNNKTLIPFEIQYPVKPFEGTHLGQVVKMGTMTDPKLGQFQGVDLKVTDGAQHGQVVRVPYSNIHLGGVLDMTRKPVPQKPAPDANKQEIKGRVLDVVR